jgi:hypothetical protein
MFLYDSYDSFIKYFQIGVKSALNRALLRQEIHEAEFVLMPYKTTQVQVIEEGSCKEHIF